MYKFWTVFYIFGVGENRYFKFGARVEYDGEC